jgi:hypothetical protein
VNDDDIKAIEPAEQSIWDPTDTEVAAAEEARAATARMWEEIERGPYIVREGQPIEPAAEKGGQ